MKILSIAFSIVLASSGLAFATNNHNTSTNTNTNTNTNTANGGAGGAGGSANNHNQNQFNPHNSNSQGQNQGQGQNQKQKQKQDQSQYQGQGQSQVGINANSQTSTSDAVSSSAGQSVSINEAENVRNAPAFGVYASGPCSGVSFAVSTVLGGGGVGFTDAECSKREAIRTFHMLGEKSIALQIAKNLQAYKDIAETLEPKVSTQRTELLNGKPVSRSIVNEDRNSAEYNRTH